MPCNDCSRAEDCPPCVNEPKDTLPRGGAEGVHVHEWGTWECIGLDRAEVWIRRCLCGASQSRSEKPLEPEFTEAVPVCAHCQGPHPYEECKGLEEPEEGAETASGGNWCGRCGDPIQLMDDTDLGSWIHSPGSDTPCLDATPDVPRPIPRRPPYAVAYAVEGGAQYEVAVSGDATVVAEDGALHILHPKKPVLAIVRIQPMNMEES